MMLQPGARERAQRDDGESVGRSPAQGRLDELAAHALAAYRRRHLSVDQDEPVSAAPVDQLRQLAVAGQLEPGSLSVVGHARDPVHETDPRTDAIAALPQPRPATSRTSGPGERAAACD